MTVQVQWNSFQTARGAYVTLALTIRSSLAAAASDSRRAGVLFGEYLEMRWSPLLAVIVQELHQMAWRLPRPVNGILTKAADATPFSRMG